MSVLKSESKRKDYVHVGTYVPRRVHNYLTLYSLVKDTTKAKLIKGMIDSWIGNNKPTLSETTLVDELIQRLNMRWKINKSQGVCIFSDYKEIVELELKEKGINKVYVTYILSKLEQ
jgi:hypothetical protein